MTTPARPVLPIRTAGASAPQPSWPAPGGVRHWRAQHLLLAPHRLGFALAVLLLMASGVWWALVLLDRATGVLGFAYALSPSLGHAAVMSLGFMPLFFTGFLFTAGPKWLAVPGPPARALAAPLLQQQAPGWLVLSAALLWAGVMLLWGLRLLGWYGRLRADGRPG